MTGATAQAPLRVLYASERPPYPFFLGGAARCAHEILARLARRLAVRCEAIGSRRFADPPWGVPPPADHAALGIAAVREDAEAIRIDCGYPVRVCADFAGALAAALDAGCPPVVWTQLEGAGAVVDAARRRGLPAILFVHDAEFDPAELGRSAAAGAHLACSSAFLARKVAAGTGRRAAVIYPAPRIDFGVRGAPHGALTMVNPHRVKGLETFLELARRFPHERFLLVESWRLTADALAGLGRRLEALPNVELLRRVPDMAPVYARTRILLAPSVWEEGFGLVAVEAQSCGIPVLASARGGLPESVGDGGRLVRDYRDVDAWADALGRLLGDGRAYAELSARALRHAQRADFSRDESARRFHALCLAARAGPGAAPPARSLLGAARRVLGRGDRAPRPASPSGDRER